MWIWSGSTWSWSPDDCCGRNVCPPSGTPPWSRPLQSPNTETLVTAGPINLSVDPTYLVRAIASPSAPQTMTLPNGNFLGQTKSICIPGPSIATSETFNVTGNFAGYSSITFNQVGFNAILTWDGTNWQIFGNCITNL